MDYQKLKHTTWNCKYHIVFIPKRRQKVIFGNVRCHLGELFHELARQKGCEIVEGHLMRDHVHMCISIPPKYAASSVVGYLKGKSAMVRAFGHADTMYQQWVSMSSWYVPTSVIRRRKMFA